MALAPGKASQQSFRKAIGGMLKPGKVFNPNSRAGKFLRSEGMGNLMHKKSLTRQQMNRVVTKLRGERTLFKQTGRQTKKIVNEAIKNEKTANQPSQPKSTPSERAKVRKRQGEIINMIASRRQTIPSTGQDRREAVMKRATNPEKDKGGDTKGKPEPTKKATADRPAFMPSGISSLGRSARRPGSYTTPETREMGPDTSSEESEAAEDTKPSTESEPTQTETPKSEEESTQDGKTKDEDLPSVEEADDMFIG